MPGKGGGPLDAHTTRELEKTSAGFLKCLHWRQSNKMVYGQHTKTRILFYNSRGLSTNNIIKALLEGDIIWCVKIFEKIIKKEEILKERLDLENILK